MNIDKIIDIKCGGEVFVDIEELHFFQNKLKSIKEDKFKALKDSLIKSGLPLSFHIWVDDKDKKWLLDGHHRWLAFKALREEGYFIAPIPCNIVKAKNRKEAAQVVLISNSRYAVINQESLAEFMIDFELQLSDLGLLDFPDVDLDDFKLDFNEESKDENNSLNNETIDKYSKNIKSPVYSPKQAEPPPISELFDFEKYFTLLNVIKSKNLSKEIETFLIHAASRHIRFNYENIAEFYCHQNKDIQDLMEESALVIIDFKKAIDNGFVNLSKELNEIFEQNYEEGSIE